MRSLAFSPDRIMIAGGNNEAALGIWDAASGNQTLRIQLEPQTPAYFVVFSPDGKSVASVSGESLTLRLWDSATGMEKNPHVGHETAVFSVAFSPDEKTIVSTGEDCTIRLWDVSSGKQIRRIRDGAPQIWALPMEVHERVERLDRYMPTGDVSLTRDGTMAISTSRDGSVRFWRLATGKEDRRIQLETSGPIRTVAYAPDGATIAVALDDDNTFGLWDLTTGKQVHRVTTGHIGASLFHIQPRRQDDCLRGCKRRRRTLGDGHFSTP